MDMIHEAMEQFLKDYKKLVQQQEMIHKLLAIYDARHHQLQTEQQELSKAHATFLLLHGFPLIPTVRHNDWPGFSVVYSQDTLFLTLLNAIEQRAYITRYFDKVGKRLMPPVDVHVVWFGIYSPEEIAAYDMQRRLLDKE